MDESGWWNNPARLSEEQQRERESSISDEKEGCDFNVYGEIQLMKKFLIRASYCKDLGITLIFTVNTEMNPLNNNVCALVLRET